jgi:hypothetical protein
MTVMAKQKKSPAEASAAIEANARRIIVRERTWRILCEYADQQDETAGDCANRLIRESLIRIGVWPGVMPGSPEAQ